ncbi:hypothetical protein RN001_001252 [Aquatica leii]|uniref:Nuclease HARBI1 n=1 Tax=Aquatica leii TaxID=1421715 RepID=A0AAN7PL14_9COLE|nr:hypothetical protein RN001_001252 [Aquatica leii]
MSSISSISSPSVSSASNLDSSSEDEVVRVPRAPRVFLNRTNPFDMLSDDEFQCRFRLSKACTMRVLRRIEGNIVPNTRRNHSISAINRLLITLRFYATGSLHQVIADHFIVTKATAGRIIHHVTHYIALLKDEYIRMPSTLNERLRVCNEFFLISDFQMYAALLTVRISKFSLQEVIQKQKRCVFYKCSGYM